MCTLVSHTLMKPCCFCFSDEMSYNLMSHHVETVFGHSWDVVFAPIKSWLHSCLSCPSRICVLCLGDLTQSFRSSLLCFCGPKSCVTFMSYLIFVPCVSQCDLISNIEHQTEHSWKTPHKQNRKWWILLFSKCQVSDHAAACCMFMFTSLDWVILTPH